MRLALVLALSLATLITAPSHASATLRTCSFVNGPAKPHVRSLIANGASCATARKIASQVRRRWPYLGSAVALNVLWACDYRWVGSHGKQWLVSCSHGAHYVGANFTGVQGPER